MDTVIQHLSDGDFVYTFRAMVLDDESIEEVEDDRWEMIAAIRCETIPTVESYRDWKKTIAVYEANRLRHEGYDVGGTTFEDE